MVFEKKYFFSRHAPNFIDFPLKLPFLKIFEIVVESSVIAHLIKNFTLKNITFFDKTDM